jgi:uncharacterized protein YicC (UPF0701 family)
MGLDRRTILNPLGLVDHPSKALPPLSEEMQRYIAAEVNRGMESAKKYAGHEGQRMREECDQRISAMELRLAEAKRVHALLLAREMNRRQKAVDLLGEVYHHEDFRISDDKLLERILDVLP